MRSISETSMVRLRSIVRLCPFFPEKVEEKIIFKC